MSLKDEDPNTYRFYSKGLFVNTETEKNIIPHSVLRIQEQIVLISQRLRQRIGE